AASTAARRAPAPTPAAAADARPSVAVLPFANTSGDARDEHLSDGLTEELIAALSRVHGLDVIARTSVFALKGKPLGVRAVAETLGVSSVVEGSLRRVGGRLKVTARLARAGDGRVLWSETYDRELRDVFAMQEEIARAIVGALRVRLAGAGRPLLVGRATDDPVAYDLFLRGRQAFSAGSGPADVRRAVALFDSAVARDPAFAQAHAGLSDAHARLVAFGFGRPRDELPLAEAAALRALALDPTVAAARAALAHALYLRGGARDSAERAMRRALALDPGYVLGRSAFAIWLQFQGRFAEAVAQMDTAAALDPLAANVGTVLGRAYVNAGRSDDAIRALQGALALGPGHPLVLQQLGHAYLQKGMAAEALDALRRAAAASGARDSAHLAYAYGVTGDRAEAARNVAALEASAARRFVPPFDLAIAHVGVGDRDAAFRRIERALAEGVLVRDVLTGTAALRPLHADARWTRLVRRLDREERAAALSAAAPAAP
ncbi:hypothetical protein, partial [Roseisolibacter sp. H3M3-2]|uniref:tetratricopeptide repeat protein n=1 Tax=Roseisolibacter sp. H3M3-2 TaxID=3031323 RepID=UPI0023DB72F0